MSMMREPIPYHPKRINACQHTATYNYLSYHLRDIDIFGGGNTTINYNCCGSHGGGFWKGVGYGAGFALANWLGGAINYFAGGFNSWMMPMNNLWQCWSGASWSGGYGGSNATSSNKTGSTGKSDEDKDQAKISDLIKRLKKLQTTNKPLETEFKQLYDEIKKLADKPIDDKNKDNNIDHYNRLLSDVIKAAKEKGYKNFPDNTSDASNGTRQTDGSGNVTPQNNNNSNADSTVSGTTPTQPNKNLTNNDEGNWNTAAGVTGLTADDITKLKNFGLSLKDGDIVPTCELSLEALKFLKNKNITVAVAHNKYVNQNGSNEGVDSWIKGKITNISESNGKLTSYDIDCTGCGMLGLTYTVTKLSKGQKYNIKYKSGMPSSGDRYFTPSEGRTYTITNGVLERNQENGDLCDPLVSKNQPANPNAYSEIIADGKLKSCKKNN